MENIDRILRTIAINPNMRLKISEEHYNYFLNIKQPLEQKENAFLCPKRLNKNHRGTYNYAAFFKVGKEYWAASCSNSAFDKSLYLKKQGLLVSAIER